jgi:hypothetical protein
LTLPRSIQSEDARRRILHFSGKRRRGAGSALHGQGQRIPRRELWALDVDLCFRSIEDRNISAVGLHPHAIHLRGNGIAGGRLGLGIGESLPQERSHGAWAAAAVIHITRGIGERQNHGCIRAYVHKHILGTGCAGSIGGRELHCVAANLRSLRSPGKHAAAGIECGTRRKTQRRKRDGHAGRITSRDRKGNGLARAHGLRAGHDDGRRRNRNRDRILHRVRAEARREYASLLFG